MLAGQPGFAVAVQVSGGSDLLQALEDHHPDLVLWDLGWATGEALEALAEVGDAGPPVLALVGESANAAEAWAAGARGLLPREASVEAIAAAIVALAQGLAVLAPDLTSAVVAPRITGAAPLPEELTPREQQVLALLAEGLANKAIANRLGISDHTVKFHINAIMGKLGAQSRTEAVVLATRLGLVSI
ncbi:MAG: response regulator transcription factor [Chloroflexi bacterium]|nr:response regulator transcription factor [Chloroflexota bacterium]